MTEIQIRIIKDSWRMLLSESSDVGTTFYNRLFYLEPGLRPLFKESIISQSKKFLDSIAKVIERLPDWNTIEQSLRVLGSRHAHYNLKELDYEKVHEALFYTLKTHFKNRWDSGMQEAWEIFYSRVIHLMRGEMNRNPGAD